MPQAQARFPKPGKGEVDADGHKCELGYSASVIVDLQRVFACLDMKRSESKPVEPSLNSGYLCAVAAAHSSFSTPVVTPMNAQSEWRLMGRGTP